MQELHDSPPRAYSRRSKNYLRNSLSVFNIVLSNDYWVRVFVEVVRFSDEERLFLYETYVMCVSATKFRQNIIVIFPRSQFEAQQAAINVSVKSGILRHLWTRNLIKKSRVHTEEKLDEIRAGVEHTSQKSLRHLARENAIWK
jgi:hypothetical protein